MKLTNFIYLLIFCLLSCNSGDCVFSGTPIPPAGYTINLIGLIEDVSPSDAATEFQMITATTGYALKNGLENKQLFKTEDGGATWTSSSIPFDFSLNSMIFTDENTGYIAHRGDDSSAFVLKTEDGGMTWENLVLPDLPLFLRDLRKDANNNLYALVGNFTGYAGVLKSTDNALSWNEIYISESSSFVSLLTVVDDRIYFKEADKLLIADLEGTILNTMTVEGNEEISVIDENNIIVVNQYKTQKTSDGGATWIEIFDSQNRMIDFSETDGLLMLLNKEYCGDNPNELSTFGKGMSDSSVLEESDPMMNFEVFTLNKVQKIGAGHYLLQMDNEIFELKQ